MSEVRTFGVEEEYLLLDRTTAAPVDHAAALTRELPEHEVEREFFSSQVETATPICRTGDEAEEALRGFRSGVARAAWGRGAVLAGTGLPPVGGDVAGTVTPRERYRAIRSEMREAASAQYVTGTHVHVEVPSRDAGVEVLARMAPWTPVLMALTANSPLWCGVDTGFASWRHVLGIGWPVRGYPPEFVDGAAYARSLEQLVASGVLLDAGVVTWVARLSQNFPTVELRIADAQLEPADAVAFGLLVRALVDAALTDVLAGVERPSIAPSLTDGAIWLAARDGLSAGLIDPTSARAVPAFDRVGQLLAAVEPGLTRAGDRDRVEAYVDRLRRSGGPAERQRAAFASGGVAALVELYRSGAPGAEASESGETRGAATTSAAQP